MWLQQNTPRKIIASTVVSGNNQNCVTNNCSLVKYVKQTTTLISHPKVYMYGKSYNKLLYVVMYMKENNQSNV